MTMIPTEYEEQVAVVKWLERNGLRFTAVPLSTYTKSWNQKRINSSMGVRAGFPDMVVLIDPRQSNDNKGHILCIEMKRRKGGSVSAEQKSWIEALKLANIPVTVAKGADEAIDFIDSFRQSTVMKRDKTTF